MPPKSVLTVITAASSYDLTTLDDVKNELQIADDDTTDDVYFARKITAVSAAIKQFCNRVFPVETVQEVISFGRDAERFMVRHGLDALQLARWPLYDTPATVVEGVTTVPAQPAVISIVQDGNTLVAGTDYSVDNIKGQITRLDAYSGREIRWHGAPVTIQYTAGFNPIDPLVADQAIKLVKIEYLGRSRDPMAKAESVAGIGSTQYVSGISMPVDVQQALLNFRMPLIA